MAIDVDPGNKTAAKIYEETQQKLAEALAQRNETSSPELPEWLKNGETGETDSSVEEFLKNLKPQ